MDAPFTTIFLHIPKTAGVSMSRVVTGQFAPEETFHVVHPQEVNSPVFSAMHGDVATLAALPDEEKLKIRCVLGHFAFGIHRCLPQPCRYITILRDPVERFVSELQHRQRDLRRETGDALAVLDAGDLVAKAPRALERQSTELSGTDPRRWLRENGTMDGYREHIAANLEKHFVWLGVVERYEDSLAVLQCELGWQDVHYERRNASNRVKTEDAYSPEFVERLRQWHPVDRDLMAYANAWLDRAIETHGERFLAARARLNQQGDSSPPTQTPPPSTP